VSEDVIEEDLNPKSRGLGRGLNALFEDEEAGFDEVAAAEGGISSRRDTIGVELLRPGTLQPRHVFDDDSIKELADSISQHGLLSPLLVREDPQNLNGYEIIAGERRWRASQKAQLHEVPVIILDIDDTKVLEIGLIENLQREDLNPIDEALGYQKLMEDYGHTQEKLAESMGKSRSYIANIVRLLNLPSGVQEMVADNGLSAGHARALITAKDPLALAKEVVSKGLSVRETEKLAADLSDKPQKNRAKSKGSGSSARGKDADTLALETEVSNALGMVVSIDSKNGKDGQLSIHFKSLDQLDDLLHRLSHFPGSKLAG